MISRMSHGFPEINRGGIIRIEKRSKREYPPVSSRGDRPLTIGTIDFCPALFNSMYRIRMRQAEIIVAADGDDCRLRPDRLEQVVGCGYAAAVMGHKQNRALDTFLTHGNHFFGRAGNVTADKKRDAAIRDPQHQRAIIGFMIICRCLAGLAERRIEKLEARPRQEQRFRLRRQMTMHDSPRLDYSEQIIIFNGVGIIAVVPKLPNGKIIQDKGKTV